MRRGSLFWGLVLLVIGVVLLMSNLGILAFPVWNILWPLFLVIVGVWVLLGVFLRGRIQGAAEQVMVPLEGAARAELKLNHGAGRVVINGGATPGELMNGSFGGGVEYRTRRSGDLLEVKLRTPEQFIYWWDGPREWRINLSNDLPLALDIKTGASEFNVNLEDVCATDLRLETGASSSSFVLPARAGMTHVAVEAGVASVSLRVPAGVAGRIRVKSGLAGVSIDAGRFPRQAGIYQSPDYATAGNKVDIDIEAGVGAVDVR